MKKILEMMNDMELNSPTDISKLYNIKPELKTMFPKQYIDFMNLYNGGEGPIGKYGYLSIWDMTGLVSFNQNDIINEYISELFYFASDRGGTIFAFATKNHTTQIVELQDDLVDCSKIKIIANSFEEFIDYIYNIDDSEFEQIAESKEIFKDVNITSISFINNKNDIKIEFIDSLFDSGKFCGSLICSGIKVFNMNIIEDEDSSFPQVICDVYAMKKEKDTHISFVGGNYEMEIVCTDMEIAGKD